MFAEETLEGDEMDLYDRFARMLGTSAPSPDFVLFLDAPTEVILGRINKRGISSEQVIQAAYLDSLRQRYYALWDRYVDAPIYVLDTSSIDYTNPDDDSGARPSSPCSRVARWTPRARRSRTVPSPHRGIPAQPVRRLSSDGHRRPLRACRCAPRTPCTRPFRSPDRRRHW